MIHTTAHLAWAACQAVPLQLRGAVIVAGAAHSPPGQRSCGAGGAAVNDQALAAPDICRRIEGNMRSMS
jgi:hypothetical protein